LVVVNKAGAGDGDGRRCCECAARGESRRAAQAWRQRAKSGWMVKKVCCSGMVTINRWRRCRGKQRVLFRVAHPHWARARNVSTYTFSPSCPTRQTSRLEGHFLGAATSYTQIFYALDAVISIQIDITAAYLPCRTLFASRVPSVVTAKD
jgi:hypothetical protein